MKRLLTLLLTLLLIACVPVPQTRDEFRALVQAGRGPSQAETLLLERDLDRTLRFLQSKATACLDVTVERSMMSGYQVHRSQSIYRPSLNRTAAQSAEFTLQVEHIPRGVGTKIPPGGLYLLAADLSAATPSTTRAELYAPTLGYDRLVETFKAWLQGRDSGCPKLP